MDCTESRQFARSDKIDAEEASPSIAELRATAVSLQGEASLFFRSAARFRRNFRTNESLCHVPSSRALMSCSICFRQCLPLPITRSTEFLEGILRARPERRIACSGLAIALEFFRIRFGFFMMWICFLGLPGRLCLRTSGSLFLLVWHSEFPDPLSQAKCRVSGRSCNSRQPL